jgi:hypothetical protein
MLEQLAFALVAVALAAPFLVPVLLSQLGHSSQDTAAVAQDERPIRLVGRKIATWAPSSSPPQLSSKSRTHSNPGGHCPMTPSSSA